MVTELKTLTNMDCWEVVERVSGSNVLPSTWAFKLKRYPDGSLSKYKARFCAGGHRRIEGTFAPVVNWTTVRLLLILSQVLNLATKQVDYTAAFVHAPIHNTAMQRADILTKGLTKVKSQAIRKLLCGW
jgi:hypothetical protein